MADKKINELVIGVLSDTHIPNTLPSLPPSLLKRLAGVDAIIHAGDMTSMIVYDILSQIAPVHAVSGNMDEFMLTEALPDKQVITLLEKRIGIIHGNGALGSVPDWVLNQFETVDIIIFGHTHSSLIEKRGSVLLINPGSVASSDKSFAILKLYAHSSPMAQIIHL